MFLNFAISQNADNDRRVGHFPLTIVRDGCDGTEPILLPRRLGRYFGERKLSVMMSSRALNEFEL